MTRNPIITSSASTADVSTSETRIVNNLVAVLGKVSIPISGKIMTPAQIVALFQSHLDATAHVANLRAQLKAAIQSEDALHATVKAAVVCVRSYVAAAYGERSTQYASLGFEPRKPAQKSAKTKAQAVDKLLATRTARHTMGKQQRAQIFGVLPTTPAESAGAPAAASAARSTPVPSTGATAANGTAASSAGSSSVAPSSAPANGTSGH
jgi:hypothetical protein